jgi:hypothetical protein
LKLETILTVGFLFSIIGNFGILYKIAEGNRRWYYFRVGSKEESRILVFEKMLLTPLGVI